MALIHHGDPGADVLTLDAIAARGPVIPVIVVDRVEDAVPLARALVAGGVTVLEITLRTVAALAAIERICAEVEGAVVGAGTVRLVGDVEAARDAGARFFVSPGYDPVLAALCRHEALPFLPGVATATEVMTAANDGHCLLKFFPAEAAGGVAMLKSLASPFADVAFCPTGGIGAGNAAAYLALPNVKVVGGSWLVPADAVAAGDWARITRLALDAQALRSMSSIL